MIRKELFLAITIAIGGLFSWACSKDNGPDEPYTNPIEANEIILKTMQDNYCWNLPATPDMMTDTKIFFSKLLNTKDTLSWIKEIAEIPTAAPTYDIGFEYAANRYDNGKTYYAILYVKKGSKAARVEIERGYLITHVSPTGLEKDQIEVTKDNYNTLLPNCITSGKQFAIRYRIPNGNEAASTFNPEDIIVNPSTVEDPLYYSNPDIYPASGKKIGYIVYNHLLSGDKLISKLNDFANEKVRVLILDFRYNATGGYTSLSNLGSSLVKKQDQAKGAAFAYLAREDGSKDTPYKFREDDNIKNLGDLLDNIYIITGQSTAGPSETLIHALRSYWGDKLIVTGEDSQGKNMVAGTKDIQLEDGTSKWRINITLGRFANKDKSYSYRTKPNIELKEINTEAGTTKQLKPLGDIEEYVLKGTLKEITGIETQTNARSSKIENWPSPVEYLGSSIKSEPGTISIDNLRP
ncbi:S41 family peptidase [Dysgonomonas capnocytophagoides]|uniref:S41 family peptidase n=1 Tax=Dysgonomonas capnocytophagoides TaxID=45254 RepID=UPI00334277B2